MSVLLSDPSLLENIQFNCDISDARDHGIYSMCSMVLKLRNLYKWENGIEPWEEPEPPDLLDWIDRKENYWEGMGEESFRPLILKGREISPYNLEEINNGLGNNGLFYGAGYGRSMKAVFFLARKIDERIVEGCTVAVLGQEQAREMASPFAMVQDGVIVIRSDSLRYFLWDQIQELRSSCRSSLRVAYEHHGLIHNGDLDQDRLRSRLDSIVKEETNLFIYHEVGEILQTTLDTEVLQSLIGRFPSSIIEFTCRALKDVLADTHPRGLLAYIIREEREATLGFYVGFLDGLREKIFPEMSASWQRFHQSRDWHEVERARAACWEKNQGLALQIKEISQMIGQYPDEQVLGRFNQQILVPLGLNLPNEN